MKLNIHDSPNNHTNAYNNTHSLKLSNPTAITSGLGYANVAQTLISLREEDPAFNKVVHVQHLDRGSLVATPDDLSQKMYVLMNGKVNMICTNNEGRRLVIATLEPGAIFGEGALDHAGDPNVFAEAAEPLSVWVIPASEVRTSGCAIR